MRSRRRLRRIAVVLGIAAAGLAVFAFVPAAAQFVQAFIPPIY